MPTKITGKPKLTKKDRAILSALPDEYQRALLHYHKVQVDEAVEHGHKPMTLTESVQAFIFEWFKDAQQRDSEARTAFEILIAPQFIHSLKAWYDAGMPSRDLGVTRLPEVPE